MGARELYVRLATFEQMPDDGLAVAGVRIVITSDTSRTFASAGPARPTKARVVAKQGNRTTARAYANH